MGCLRAERHRNSPPAVVWVCALQLTGASIFNREPLAHATINYSLFIVHFSLKKSLIFPKKVVNF